MLKPTGYRRRLAEKLFDEYLGIFGAVCIEGPKYCGKTWMGRSRCASAAFVGDPANNFQTRRMATVSPSLVLEGDSSGQVSLGSLFRQPLLPQATGEVELRQLIHYVVRGGWPGNLDTPEASCGRLAIEHLKAVIDDDLYRVDGIKRDSRKLWSLIRSLARNESTIVSNSTLRRDMEAMDEVTVDPNTVSDYLDILNRLFLLDDQPAYSPRLRSSRRLLKSPKRHFVDVSLAVAALSATPDMLYNDLNTFGLLFEGLCQHDLKIYAQYNGAATYHLRDEKGTEADLVVEFPDGTWGAFQIKLGASQIDGAAANLLKIKRIMEKEGGNPPKLLCVACGMSSMAYQREDGVHVVPLTALGP